jgi:hypothetical protein
MKLQKKIGCYVVEVSDSNVLTIRDCNGCIVFISENYSEEILESAIKRLRG